MRVGSYRRFTAFLCFNIFFNDLKFNAYFPYCSIFTVEIVSGCIFLLYEAIFFSVVKSRTKSPSVFYLFLFFLELSVSAVYFSSCVSLWLLVSTVLL